MSKRRPAARKPPLAPPPARRKWGPVLLLATAIVLALGGLLELRATWRNLPLPRLELLERPKITQAFTAGRQSMSTEARAGLILGTVSERFTEAWQEPDQLATMLDEARSALAQTSQAQLGRLQLAAFAMLRLQHDSVPPADWWPSLEPYLSGLENASFQHFLPQWTASNAATYAQLGLGPGTARVVAASSVGFPHGPFLEYFVEQMARVTQSRRDAGDVTATTQCQRLVYRLLREWVLDPGPATLRLLAADLLARDLAADTGPNTPPTAAEIARGLGQWRDAYRENAIKRPSPLPLLDSSYGPLLNPPEHDRLRNAVALNTWLGGALGMALVAAVLAGWMWPRGRRPVLPVSSALLTGGGIAIVIVALGLVWLDFAPGSVQADLLHTGSDALGWPRHPFVAAALLLGLWGAATFAFASTAPRWQRLGAYAMTACLGLALALLITCAVTRAETATFERSLERACEQGEFEAITGPQTDRQLDPLRTWNP